MLKRQVSTEEEAETLPFFLASEDDNFLVSI
jgi:hypothetical protein